MSDTISRRNFLKLSGLSAAAAVLTGCGPAARYVTRRPYYEMPEYAVLGESTYFATTCTECPAGCGLILRTFEGRALKAEGNPAHPVNRGKLCSRGLTGVQGLYNPDRIQRPGKRTRRGDPALEPMDWDSALGVVHEALNGAGAGVAFYLGLAPDHLYDLVLELTQTIGAPPPVRFGALGMFESRATLVEAVRQVFGEARFPYFDLAGADVVVSFGANFLETWLSPVAYTRGFSQFRRADGKKRGYLVSFEARRSLTSGVADEWLPVPPGTEGQIALALGSLLQGKGWKVPMDVSQVDVEASAAAAGISMGRLEQLADRIARAEHPLFIPGGQALAHAGGLVAARNILLLNLAAGNMGRPGGIFLSPSRPDSGSLREVQALIEQMRAGKVETLFIHGANPVFELPPALGFMEALANVPRVISFASFPDETALQSDYVLPDHTPLESWGYQRTLAGSDRMIFSSLQPVVVPLYDTRATADVLLSAGKLPYNDEVTFLQSKLATLLNEPGVTVEATEIATFWARYLQAGGWWSQQAGLTVPATQPDLQVGMAQGPSAPEGQFHLITYPTHLGDGSGANRPWLQETPSPSTTVMWNTWVEVHPQLAEKLGLKDDDVVRVTSPSGSIEAVVYLFPAIRPDTVAIPFGQGHTALGRWAEGRGANPAALLGAQLNEAGDLAFGDVLVTLSPTGRRRPLSRLESRAGVYGEH